jgi:hypothetical protein
VKARSILAGSGGIVALFVGLAVIDSRVRAAAAELATGHVGGPALTATGSRAQEFFSIVMLSVKDQSLAHMPLVVFSAAAMALVVFMLRT